MYLVIIPKYWKKNRMGGGGGVLFWMTINEIGIIFRYRFTKYLKKNYGLGSDEHCSFIYVTKNALVRTLKERTKIVTAFLAAAGKFHAILLKLVSF